MSLDDVYLESGERMESSIRALADRLGSIRTGRASPALLEHLKVDYYGTQTALRQLANISAPEARLLVIKPFDPSSLQEISKAIIAGDLGLNPQSDGKLLRVAFPAMTEETRRKQGAVVREEGEKARVAIRTIRRDANRELGDIKKKGEAPEDDCFKMKDEIQELTNDSEKKVTQLVDDKTREIMEI